MNLFIGFVSQNGGVLACLALKEEFVRNNTMLK